MEQQQNVGAPASSDSAFTLSFGWDETKQAAARPRQLHEEVTTMRLNDGPVEGSDEDLTEGSLGFQIWNSQPFLMFCFCKGSKVVQFCIVQYSAIGKEHGCQLQFGFAR